jgi:carbon-monoxide dehydrogenase medium subunit
VIPAPFEYERPASLEPALQALAGGEGMARPIAGGQSLLPLMKLRLARPERLVDIGRFAELRGVRDLPDGGLAIGALTTWAELLDDPRVTARAVLADAIPTIGDVQVRNRGTIGGSIAHADPASDIAAPLLALSAEVIVRSTQGERRLPVSGLYAGPFATTLEPGELITEILLPASRAGAGSAYVSLSHPASGYPVAGVAVVVHGGGDGARGSWVDCAVAVTGVGEMPYLADAVRQAVLGGESAAAAASVAADGQRVLSDPYADRDYRTAMARVMAERALDLAIERAR